MIGRITARQIEALRLYEQLGTYAAVGKAMGIHPDAALRHCQRGRKNGGGGCLADIEQPDTLAFQKTTVQYARDQKGNWQPVQEWRRMAPTQENLDAWVQALCDRVEGQGPVIAKPTKPRRDDLMFVLILPDLHIGERIWWAECGTNWDARIAVSKILGAIITVLDRAGPVGRIVIKNLGDVTHADNNRNQTPKSQHQLDVDGRHHLNVERARDLLCFTIEHAATLAPLVQYRSVTGNHDQETNYHLALILDAYYRNLEQVEIVLDRRKHQYWTYGNTAFMDTHGDTGKPNRLKDVFATTPEWKSTDCHRIHSGHYHVDRVIPFAGCRFEIFEPPIPTGKYATEEAFGGDGQQIVGIFYDKKRGELGRIREPIIPEPVKPVHSCPQ